MLALAAWLGACGSPDVDEADSTDPEREPGIYEVDSETGEIRARVVQEDGSVATMRSGENVPLALPTGFSMFPDARVTSNTVVETAQGSASILILQSEATPAEVVEFYRQQAEAAGFEFGLDLSAGGAEMLAGESADGRAFSVSASREASVTVINLTIGHGGG